MLDKQIVTHHGRSVEASRDRSVAAPEAGVAVPEGGVAVPEAGVTASGPRAPRPLAI